MGTVEVVDRGSTEIVVFMSGDIDDSMQSELDDAIEAVTRLEPPRVVVDTHNCTGFGQAGIHFLDRLRQRGRTEGYQVDLAAIGPAVRPVLEDAGWIHQVMHPPHG